MQGSLTFLSRRLLTMGLSAVKKSALLLCREYLEIMQGFAVETNGCSRRNHSPITKKFVNPKLDLSNTHNSSAKSRFSSSLLSLRCLPREIVPPLSGIGKTSWPELVGTNGDYAASVIKRENPNLYAKVYFDEYAHGRLMTMDFSSNRVRVFVDRNRIVKHIPTFRQASSWHGTFRGVTKSYGLNKKATKM